MNTVFWKMSDRKRILAPETGVVFITGEGTHEGIIVAHDGSTYTVLSKGTKVPVKAEHIIGIEEA